MSDNTHIAARWRVHGLLLLAACAVLALGYWQTFTDLVGVWSTSSTFNHCFLIPFIALYLGYTKIEELERLAPSVSGYGVLYIVANALLWLAGEVMSLAVFMHAAVVGMLIGCAWALLGQAVFRLLMFPLFYLYFAVPEGEFLVPYLQDWTALVMVSLLKLIGMPVFVEGRYVSIPSGNFTVAEACSGINYLIATLSVAAMFAYLQFRSNRRRALFMLAAIIVPLVANGIRAFGIVIISHLSGYKLAQGVDHFIYGWVFFGMVITVLFWVGRAFSDVDESVATRSIAAPPVVAPARRPWLVFALALALTITPRGVLLAVDSSRPLAPPIELHAVAGWQGPSVEARKMGLKFPGADQELSQSYQAADGSSVVVEIAYFRAQGDKGELINQNNRIFDPQAWRQVAHAVRELDATASPSSVNEIRLRDDLQGQDYLVWYWYDTQAVRSSGGLPIKLAEGRARLRGLNAGSALVSIRTATAGGGQEAVARLTAFLSSGAPLLENMHAQP